ncbi:UNVERIFIED_CONTAM: hypothetical protein Slati_3895100 [Sesamum latifolium]
MAEVRQFTGNSSAITPSVKGMPACSSAGAPITWYWISCNTFWRYCNRATNYGGTSPAWAGSCVAGPSTALGLGIVNAGSACSRTVTSDGVVTSAGTRTASCSLMVEVIIC